MPSSSSLEDRYAVAPDGFLARKNGIYAEKKLEFLDVYLPAALVATKKMHRRWYLDLFAGPGWNVGKHNTNYSFAGSPYRALTAHEVDNPYNAFTRVVLVNQDDIDDAELIKRVELWTAKRELVVPKERIELRHEDANIALPSILQSVPKLDYVFAFADIEGINELPWETVKALLSQGHHSVDLYVLLPLEMTIQRLIAYDEDKRARYDQSLTAFFGTAAWSPLARAARTGAQAPQFRQSLVDLYVSQLRTLWKHVEVQATVYMTGERSYYRMIFASNHPVADRIAAWQRSDDRQSQMGLGI